MTQARFGLYCTLVLWEGALAHAQFLNILDGRWLYAVINSALLAAVFVVLVLMKRHDVRLGRFAKEDR